MANVRDMDRSNVGPFHPNRSSIAVNGPDESDTIFNWLEMASSAFGFLINGYIILIATVSSKYLYRSFVVSLVNLSVGQSLVCALSLSISAGAALLRQGPAASWYQATLQNTMIVVFCCVCMTGTAVLSWSHWWFALSDSASCRMNAKADCRLDKVVVFVLWLAASLFVIRLGLVTKDSDAWPALGIAFDRHVASSLANLYVAIFVTSFAVVLVANLTVFTEFKDAKVKHRTLVLMQHMPDFRHRCSADCPCSGSEPVSPMVGSKTSHPPAAKQPADARRETPPINTKRRGTKEKNESNFEEEEEEKRISDSNDPLADVSSSTGDNAATVETVGPKLPRAKLKARLVRLNSRRIEPQSPASPEVAPASNAAMRTGRKRRAAAAAAAAAIEVNDPVGTSGRQIYHQRLLLITWSYRTIACRYVARPAPPEA